MNTLAAPVTDGANEDAGTGTRGGRSERGDNRGEPRGEGRRDRSPRRERRPDGGSGADTSTENLQTAAPQAPLPEQAEDAPRYSYFNTPTASSPVGTDGVTPAQDRGDGTSDAAVKAQAADNTPIEVNDTEQAARAPREKRSRDRYGRDRRERNGGRQRGDDGATESESVDGASQDATVEAVATQATATPTIERVTTPLPVATTIAVAAAVVETGKTSSKSLPNVQAFELPLQDLHILAQSAGLEWVGSDADKVAQAQAAIAATPAPVHVPRERKVMAVLDEGPLVLVETRKDLSAMTLPFDNQQN